MEWTLLSNNSIDVLLEDALKGKLRRSNFRSIYFSIFLNILPPNSSEWLSALEESRTKYKIIMLKHNTDPHKQDSGPDNPLSQDDDVRFHNVYL